MAKLNIIPYVYKYGGSVYNDNEYLKENFRKVMAIYAEYIQAVFKTCTKVMFSSQGVVARLEEMFGEVKYNEHAKYLLEKNKVFSLFKHCNHNHVSSGCLPQ